MARNQPTLATKQPVGLSYINPDIRHSEDGTVSANLFFHSKKPVSRWSQSQVSMMLKGGVRLVVLSHGQNEPERFPGAMDVEYMMRCLDGLLVAIETHPRCELIRTRSDLDRAVRADKLGIILHLTGASTNGSMQILRNYWRLGVRSIHPFIRSVEYGGEYKHPEIGLTPLGKVLVREMERVGMIVDVTHANDKTTSQVLRMARQPVIDSHTTCRSLCNERRNRTDAHIREIAKTGGFVGIHFASWMLTSLRDKNQIGRNQIFSRKRIELFEKETRGLDDPYAFMAYRTDPLRWSRELNDLRAEHSAQPQATMDILLDHIERMIELAGIDHVCIGADYMLSSTCEGVETAEKVWNIGRGLSNRGYRQRELDKVMGANLFRFFRENLPK